MAMLLGAARILKDMEESLKGTVKLLFQPGEETGARMMVENGLLENHKVNAAKAWNGDYERITDEAGISVVDPDTFQYVENENPISFMNYFEAVYNGFVNGATIMGTLFISSGVIYLLECSGAFGAGISMILKKTRGKEFSVVCIFIPFSLSSACWAMEKPPTRFTRWRSSLCHTAAAGQSSAGKSICPLSKAHSF